MKIILIFLILSSAVVVIYPTWGLLSPETYLHELLEQFPSVNKTSVTQIKLAALIQIIANLILASVFINLARYMQTPTKPKLLKFAALTLMIYPFLTIIFNLLIGMVLSQHLQQPQLHIELSASSLFYLVMGAALLGINKTQQQTPLEQA
ncbi:hypothetical protein MSG37_19270 [Shewanella sp. 1CM18E]|uniref:hypothetical protein n=1 Tax=Shewanella sp. 1CM18E TaxID=2929169 RepID=UPI0020C090DD|nr:hypothetical protein [Shewanella sp. 1CM18E]MCK8047033.1 hypothetical protein [Shewanella sp. 1CM18E]